MKWIAKWIKPVQDMGDVCPVYMKNFLVRQKIKKAELFITAMGVYEAVLNGKRVGDFILAPGWTSYEKRLQVQRYDVTNLLKEKNKLEVTVGKGWYRSPMAIWCKEEERPRRMHDPAGLTAFLRILWEDGEEEKIVTDEKWVVGESKIRFSEIYNGETFDAGFKCESYQPVVCFDYPVEQLIEQQGEIVKEQDYVTAVSVFTTPSGETVVDFGQEVTGYVCFSVNARAGDIVEISHGEVLDKEGNFYNANYRSARAKLTYICHNGEQTYKPHLTFFGFRYIRLDKFPEIPLPEHFIAIVVHSDMKRTGYLNSSNVLLNRLFSNIIWGQKGNFLDIPTDCPQRDERLGWTGDAQVFVKTASYNYDVERFFTKWLADMGADQRPDGSICHFVPDLVAGSGSAAWDDAVTICPWQIYLTYGDSQILRQQFDCMKKYIGFITNTTKNRYLWIGGTHYGDWLGLDALEGSYKGVSRADFIASAFYAYSTSLVIKAGRVLEEDVSVYEKLYENIVKTFRNTYTDYRTQTEYALALHFHLTAEPQKAADALAKMVISCGSKLQTGFVGTAYLLYALSGYGYTKLAYTLLLRTEYPSWLYSVTKGATTIWEHWDGIKENGDFWNADMNSFNHYAYGAVAGWIYEVAAGISPVEEAPGFAKVKIVPMADERLEWLEASIKTRHGLVYSRWQWVEINGKKRVRYDIITPSPATIIIEGKIYSMEMGKYVFFGK